MRLVPYLLRTALIAALFVLGAPLVARASNDEIVKVEVGETKKLKIVPVPGCKAHFTVTGGNPAIATVKHNAKPMYQKKLKLKITGVSVGTTIVNVGYTLMESNGCSGGGTIRVQIQVVASTAEAVKAIVKAFESETKQAKKEMKQAYEVASDNLIALGKGLASSETQEQDIMTGFDEINCGVFDIYHAAWSHAVQARDFATSQLQSAGIKEEDLPHDVVAGTCDEWDKFLDGLREAASKYTMMTFHTQKKFYDLVEKHTDWRITGTYRSGVYINLPGPVGAMGSPHDDPPHDLAIFGTWALSRQTQPGQFETWVLTGGQSDPGLGNIVITGETTQNGNLSRTATPDANGKWSVEFPPSDGFPAGSTFQVRAKYQNPQPGFEDHDRAWVRIKQDF